jgi:hypothetical protein
MRRMEFPFIAFVCFLLRQVFYLFHRCICDSFPRQLYVNFENSCRGVVIR